MAQNLRDRLRRIREAERARDQSDTVSGPGPAPVLPGWEPAGVLTVRRRVTMELPWTAPQFPLALMLLLPDIRYYVSHTGTMPAPEDLVFFDLETTGLSSGAGTVAFLAAFGRLTLGRPGDRGEPADISRLCVTQYLLLDYPGEGEFLEALIRELAPGTDSHPAGRPPLVVSYNGKTFDSQILKTRRLMNGMRPPVFFHGDLLHPAQRLWRRVLPSCSQGEIETAILGLDRNGDIPGSEAPDIWFSFLKTGNAGPLLGICDHNRRDIYGLAALFNALVSIAANPQKGLKTYRGDMEQAAIHWRKQFRCQSKAGSFHSYTNAEIAALGETGFRLLRDAAERGPRAALVLALDMFNRHWDKDGRAYLLALTGESGNDRFPQCPERIKAAAYRALAIDAEYRLHDTGQALIYTERALGLEGIRESLRKDFSRRRDRLTRQH